ncbi:hypothetical protein LZ906_007320 [Paraclostridium ghonii]|uniref:YhgE/Pip domain-containing protein n=1 Tax=Paraclostridium ghonii TaxID=29358 RepID=UPI00202CF771|nr:hypothetical protein [Paeniclostridium ghonii]MCM0167627.1 hypothetical protein [Paeniclostridium ghonii]
MNFKKIISFFILIITVSGISFLSIYFVKKFEDNLIKSNDIKVSSNIAIVNQDAGIEKENKYTNYSEKIIENMDSKYILTSREVAKNGLKNGEFSALIIFPGKFSHNVVSINNENPEKAQFYYELSPKLGNVEKAEIRETITQIEREINDKISYIYVANILNEFHDSQDKVVDVLGNNDKQVKKILSVNDNDLVKSIELRDFEKKNIDISTLDLNSDFDKNQKVMEDMDSNYKKFLAEGNAVLNTIKSTAENLITKESGLLSFLDNIASINVLPIYFNGIQFQDVIESTQHNFNEFFTNKFDETREKQDNKIDELDKNGDENLSDGETSISSTTDDVNKNIEVLPNTEDETKKLNDEFDSFEKYLSDIKANISEEESKTPELVINTSNDVGKKIEQDITNTIDSTINSVNEYNKSLKSSNSSLEALKSENKINALISETSTSLLISGEPTTKDSLINSVSEKIDYHTKTNEINFEAVKTNFNNNHPENKVNNLDEYLNYVLSNNSEPTNLELKQYELTNSFNKLNILESNIDLEKNKELILDNIKSELSNYDKTQNEKLKLFNERYEGIKKSYVDQVDNIKKDSENSRNSIKDSNNQLIKSIDNQVKEKNEKNKGLINNLKEYVSYIFGGLKESTKIANNDVKQSLNENTDLNEKALKYENSIYMSSLRESIRKTESTTKDGLKKSFMEKQEPLDQLNGEIDKYNPIDYITKNQSIFTNLISDYNQNNVGISDKINEQDQKNIKFTEETYEKADEHVEQLKEDVLKTKEESEKLITDGLKEAKEGSINNSNEDKKLMGDFSNKLPYTRVGSLSNLKTYDFISTPLESINTTNNNNEIKDTNVLASSSDKSFFDKYKGYTLFSGLLTIVLLMFFIKLITSHFNRKDKVEHE